MAGERLRSVVDADEARWRRLKPRRSVTASSVGLVSRKFFVARRSRAPAESDRGFRGHLSFLAPALEVGVLEASSGRIPRVAGAEGPSTPLSVSVEETMQVERRVPVLVGAPETTQPGALVVPDETHGPQALELLVQVLGVVTHEGRVGLQADQLVELVGRDDALQRDAEGSYLCLLPDQLLALDVLARPEIDKRTTSWPRPRRGPAQSGGCCHKRCPRRHGGCRRRAASRSCRDQAGQSLGISRSAVAWRRTEKGLPTVQAVP